MVDVQYLMPNVQFLSSKIQNYGADSLQAPAFWKSGTKLLDYTPLSNFPAPKLLRNPIPRPPYLICLEANSSPEGRERGSVSPQGGSLFPPPTPFGSNGDSFTHEQSWRHKEPT